MEELNIQGLKESNPALYEKIHPHMMDMMQHLKAVYPPGYRFTEEQLEEFANQIAERSGVYAGADDMQAPMSEYPEAVPTVSRGYRGGYRGGYHGGSRGGFRGGFRGGRYGYGGSLAKGLLIGSLLGAGYYPPYPYPAPYYPYY